ncbi:hypothetical protein ANRL1_04556 [Anaerolineae bacterium]|nr:hypothetical protein ANRL1_04556 [Anaerolineae bacterium]
MPTTLPWLYHDYQESRSIGFGFYACLLSAMRQADTDNLEKLKSAFPEVWDELRARYNAPGGVLPNDGYPYAELVEDFHGREDQVKAEFARLSAKYPDLAQYYSYKENDGTTEPND